MHSVAIVTFSDGIYPAFTSVGAACRCTGSVTVVQVMIIGGEAGVQGIVPAGRYLKSRWQMSNGRGQNAGPGTDEEQE